MVTKHDVTVTVGWQDSSLILLQGEQCSLTAQLELSMLLVGIPLRTQLIISESGNAHDHQELTFLSCADPEGKQSQKWGFFNVGPSSAD